jgi:branched-chain amino acid aminotransferase
MAFDTRAAIWFNGELVPWENAQLHVLSHALHYGSSVFEGIRCYKTRTGPAIFRLDRHLDRLFDSCKIYRIHVPYDRKTIEQACVDVVRENGFEECYIRPVAYLGYNGETLGVDPHGFPTQVAIAAYAWGRYLGPEAIEVGVRACVSSWTRLAPNTLPTLAKTAANYMNSQLIKMQAREDGYDEGIALDSSGRLSEGSGENIFLVHRGVLHTPPLASCVLPGITRDTIITLARDAGIEVREEPLPREMLYVADEVFFSGTAAEISPITSVDKIPVGTGLRGPVTRKLQDMFFGIVNGEIPDRHNWLLPIPPREDGSLGTDGVAPKRLRTQQTVRTV